MCLHGSAGPNWAELVWSWSICASVAGAALPRRCLSVSSWKMQACPKRDLLIPMTKVQRTSPMCRPVPSPWLHHVGKHPVARQIVWAQNQVKQDLSARVEAMQLTGQSVWTQRGWRSRADRLLYHKCQEQDIASHITSPRNPCNKHALSIHIVNIYWATAKSQTASSALGQMPRVHDLYLQGSSAWLLSELV